MNGYKDCLYTKDFNLQINVRPLQRDMEGADLVLISMLVEDDESIKNVFRRWLDYFEPTNCPIIFVLVYENDMSNANETLVSSFLFVE